MRLKATVSKVSGSARHSVGVLADGNFREIATPVPDSVEIVENDGAFYLLHLDISGACIADTWHQSLTEAKAQAEFEFGIKSNDWENSPDA